MGLDLGKLFHVDKTQIEKLILDQANEYIDQLCAKLKGVVKMELDKVFGGVSEAPKQ